MSLFPLTSEIFSTSFQDPDLKDIFSDEHFIAKMLYVESQLAHVQAKLAIIPMEAAEAIQDSLAQVKIDIIKLSEQTDRDGVPVSELVKQLRGQLPKEAASYLHWGATTQDIMDTALVLQLREALRLFEAKLKKLMGELSALTEKHRHSLMAGRSHSQQALPITFGFKVANWLMPLLRHVERLEELKKRLFTLQFGGAVGTLASLADKGLEVHEALARTLDLHASVIAWHTQRDNLVEVATWAGMVSGSLAKMAQDIILLAQNEVGELRESGDLGRGGSSTMPQKSNPIQSEIILAAARHNASLIASMHHALIQEHERATHGWQLEWLNLPQILMFSMVALNKALFLSQNLQVNEAQMLANLKASQGLMMAEALEFALSQKSSRSEAKNLVKTAVLALNQKPHMHLIDELKSKLGSEYQYLDLDRYYDESHYLGVTQKWIDRVLNISTMYTLGNQLNEVNL
ncbi:MAG: 3-carboxy-cis,cis-muconate cycloisomerase [Deinococcales bacterium]